MANQNHLNLWQKVKKKRKQRHANTTGSIQFQFYHLYLAKEIRVNFNVMFPSMHLLCLYVCNVCIGVCVCV